MEQGKILSIRLSPDGLSFWTTSLAASLAKDASAHPDLWSRGGEKSLTFDPSRSIGENIRECTEKIKAVTGGNFSEIEVFPDTMRNVAVPEELLPEGSESAYLAANSIAMSPGEAVFRAEIMPGIVSLAACDAEAIRLLNEAWKRECTVRSPFSINASIVTKYGAGRRRKAVIYLTPGNVYISVFEKKSGAILYMDTLRWAADADVLYAITLLYKEFDLKKSKIYIRGTKAEQVHKLLRRYYRKSICE